MTAFTEDGDRRAACHYCGNQLDLPDAPVATPVVPSTGTMQPPRSFGPTLGIALVVLVGGTVTAGYFAMKPKMPPQEPEPVVAESHPPSEVRQLESDVEPPPAASPSTAPVQPAPPPEPIRPNLPIDVTWSGVVKKSSHPDVKRRAKCLMSLEGSIDPNKNGSEKVIRLSCGKTVLYDSEHPAPGMTRYGFGVGEKPGESPGDWVYAIRLSDTGNRSGRNLIQIDSASGVAGKLTGSTGRNFEVEFQLDRYSTPRQGSSLFDTPKRLGTTKRLTKVSASDGEAPADPGGECNLELELLEVRGLGSGRCRASLTCSKTQAYPASKRGGFGTCEFYDEGNPTSFDDEKVSSLDGDASLSVVGDAVRASDDPVDGKWSLEASYVAP